MERPGARMLDVGAGVAALAVAWATAFEHLNVVAIDVLPRALELARETVASSSAKDRISLRQQDVATLDERAAYELVWLPAPFLPEAALRMGVQRAADALVDGGWVMVGHGKYGGDPVDDAVGRFKTVAYGGTALDNDQAQQLSSRCGVYGCHDGPHTAGRARPHRGPAGTRPCDRLRHPWTRSGWMRERTQRRDWRVVCQRRYLRSKVSLSVQVLGPPPRTHDAAAGLPT